MSYAMAPHVVTWEVTRACQLHCRHCRAKAVPRRDASELTLPEMQAVMDDLAVGFDRPPVVVITGGDPLERPDLDDIVRGLVSRHIVTAVAPSVTPKLTPQVAAHWKDLGVHSVSLSLDGVDAVTHDRFRGFRGTFDRTMAMADAIVQAGLRLQINSSISQQTVHQLGQMGNLVEFLGVSSWELFFVIPTGRARLMDALSADEIEAVLVWLAGYSVGKPFRITAVGAPQWTRVLHQRNPDAPIRTVAREARGFAFIDHRGEVYPSGYLPVSAGSVKNTPFSEIYRRSPLFELLRDPGHFEGPCGACEFNEACGGSRARAYAVSGRMDSSDPGCAAALVH